MSDRSLQHLLVQLKEVRELRDRPGGYAPRVEYCLLCDEANVRVRDKRTGEYPKLDCRHDHYVIEDSHDHAGISEWIDCIEYLQEHYLNTGSDQS